MVFILSIFEHLGLTKTFVLVESNEKHNLFSLMAFLGKLNKRRKLRNKTRFILRNPGVSSMIMCAPQDFKWAATQPFEGIVSSFFTRKQDSDKTSFCPRYQKNFFSEIKKNSDQIKDLNGDLLRILQYKHQLKLQKQELE